MMTRRTFLKACAAAPLVAAFPSAELLDNSYVPGRPILSTHNFTCMG